MLNANLTDEDREAMQVKVEKLHRKWTKDSEYLPAPAQGELAELDSAMIVAPPIGFEYRYVPIVSVKKLNELLG